MKLDKAGLQYLIWAIHLYGNPLSFRFCIRSMFHHTATSIARESNNLKLIAIRPVKVLFSFFFVLYTNENSIYNKAFPVKVSVWP